MGNSHFRMFQLRGKKLLGERHLTLYRKPTFTGQYTRYGTWDSVSCQRYKIKSLVRRSMRICTNDTLEDEIQQLRRIFNNNGYPANVVERVICVTHGPAQQLVGPKKYRVFLRLPWIGTVASTSFEKKIRRAVGSAYGACAVNVVFKCSLQVWRIEFPPNKGRTWFIYFNAGAIAGTWERRPNSSRWGLNNTCLTQQCWQWTLERKCQQHLQYVNIWWTTRSAVLISTRQGSLSSTEPGTKMFWTRWKQYALRLFSRNCVNEWNLWSSFIFFTRPVKAN